MPFSRELRVFLSRLFADAFVPRYVGQVFNLSRQIKNLSYFSRFLSLPHFSSLVQISAYQRSHRLITSERSSPQKFANSRKTDSPPCPSFFWGGVIDAQESCPIVLIRKIAEALAKFK
jgi:hypothetical protein